MTTNSWVWIALAEGDAETLRKAPADFNMQEVHPHYGTVFTALLVHPQNVFSQLLQNADPVDLILQFLVSRGARPDAVVPASCGACLSFAVWSTKPVSGKSKAEVKESTTSSLRVMFSGKSAIEVLLEFRTGIERAQQDFRDHPRELSPEYVPWEKKHEQVNALLRKYLSLMPDSSKSRVPRLDVPEAVVDLWERVFRASDSADLTISSPSGSVIQKVHRNVFAEISHVTKAMLLAPMCERRDGIIQFEDDPAAVQLFLSLVYTGCVPAHDDDKDGAPQLKDFLGALSLSHRLAAAPFTAVLAERLQTLVSAESFEEILDAAVRHDIAPLRESCLEFAKNDEVVKAKFAAGGYQSPEVIGSLQKLFGRAAVDPCKTASKRRRVL